MKPDHVKRYAYSVMEVKSVSENDTHYTITGIASTPTADRQGDIVEPMGAQFSMPMPLLWQHESKKPVGNVVFAKPNKNGIPYTATLPKISEPGNLKDRVDEAIQSIKYKLVTAVSIGFQPVWEKVLEIASGYRYMEWEWLELSLVTIPANREATIQTIKSIDQAQQRSASGAAPVVRLDANPPGASGNRKSETPKGKHMATIQEQIQGFEAKRAASSARMNELMKSAAEAGATLDVAETEEYDGLEVEVKGIDSHLVRLKRLENANIKQAQSVDGSTADVSADAVQKGAAGNVAAPRGRIEMGRSTLPKGIAFARYAMALAFSKGNIDQAARMSERWKDTSPEVGNVLKMAGAMGGTDFVSQGMQNTEDFMRAKAAIAAGTTTDATWANPLVQYTNMAAEFVSLLYPKTILGQLTGLRRVPFNIRFPTQTAGATVGWVGEGAAKPVSKLAFTTTTMPFAKAAGIVVITTELARFSSPSAEALVRDDLVNTIAQFEDVQFISPGVAAVTGVNPASITNGITPVQSSGTTRAAMDMDVATLFGNMVAANIPFTSLAWVMTPYEAMKLSMQRETNGEFSYPGISIIGGTWQGIPVVVSNNVPHSVSGGSIIVLVAQNEIFFADDGGVQLDASDQASLQMDSAPTNNGTTPTPTTLVSLWQDNLIGIRAEVIVNWQRRRAAAVGYIDNVS